MTEKNSSSKNTPNINCPKAIIEDGYSRKLDVLTITVLSTFLMGVILIITCWYLECGFLYKLGILLFSVVAPILGVIRCGFSLRSNKKRSVICSIGLTALWVLIFMIFGVPSLRYSLEYIYTPPAITAKKLALYKKSIQFIRGHNEYKYISFDKWGRIRLDDQRELLSEGRLPEDEIDILSKLCRQLRENGIHHVEKTEEGIVLFVQETNYIFPTSPGVLCFLGDEDINEIGGDFLNTLKPLYKISGNWYISRHLIARRIRKVKLFPLPDSLIDHSLRIDGLNLTDNDG